MTRKRRDRLNRLDLHILGLIAQDQLHQRPSRSVRELTVIVNRKSSTSIFGSLSKLGRMKYLIGKRPNVIGHPQYRLPRDRWARLRRRSDGKVTGYLFQIYP